MKLARGGLAAALVSSLSVLAASCVGILELDGYAGALNDLCEKLRECYGDEYFPECEAHGEPRIVAATTEEREAWLQNFADQHCLESCANARACLDMSPVCGAPAEGCVQKEECCGFLTGAKECGGNKCCSGEGKGCGVADDCCDPSLGCELDTSENEVVCGGVACADPNESCEVDEQCCTGRCDPVMGICAEEICLPEGSRCQENDECCTKFCDRQGDGGMCLPPPCLPDGELCSGGMGDITCCSPFCVVNPYSNETVCSSGQCLPDAQWCGSDFECCSGYCDPMQLICLPTCGQAGDPCSMGCCPFAACGPDDTCCLSDLALCISDGECCSGDCDENFVCKSTNPCNPPGSTCMNGSECCTGNCDGVNQLCCDQVDCHDECVQGGPLSLGCPVATDNLSISCIAAVCQQDPFCCCEKWDQACVDVVPQLCGNPCDDPVIQVETMNP